MAIWLPLSSSLCDNLKPVVRPIEVKTLPHRPVLDTLALIAGVFTPYCLTPIEVATRTSQTESSSAASEKEHKGKDAPEIHCTSPKFIHN